MGAAGGLEVVLGLGLCLGKWGPRAEQVQVPRCGMNEGVWGEEGEVGMGSPRCEQGPSAHRLWTAGQECGGLGRPGVDVCIGAAAGAGSVTDRGAGQGGALMLRLQVKVPGCRTQ